VKRRTVALAFPVLCVVALMTVSPTDAGAARAAKPRTPRTSTSCSSSDAARPVIYQAARDGRGGAVDFTDATSAWNLDEPLRGMLVHTVAAGDVNGDGWTDLFVGSFADRQISDYKVRGADGPTPDRLLLGGPKGFTVDPKFPGGLGRTSGAVFADLDGDGWPDLVIARNVKDVERGRTPSEILRNDHGTFARAATLPNPSGARSIGLLDFDHDGKLDLIITEDRWTGKSSRLLHNDGDFQFSDVTKKVGLPLDIIGMGVATADLNGDGTPDLFVGGSNRIFLSDASGSFHEGDSKRFAWPTYGAEDDPAGVAVGDLNRDGRPDLVVGEHYGSTIDFGKRVPVRLYLNAGNDGSGDPRFVDVTEEAGLVGLATKAPDVEIADLDGDGWPDIVTTASVDDRTPVVFRNLGTSSGDTPRFAANGKSGPAQYWPSSVVFDADHDGRLDVVLGEFDDKRPSLVLRNTSDVGHWLGVSAQPGSTVDVFDAHDLGDRDHLLGSTTVNASTGFGSGPTPVAWFGLGATTSVDVRISNHGKTLDTLRAQPVDRMLGVSCSRP
jgi:hypothetical protein